MILPLVIILCACEFDESANSFKGGQLLDSEAMESIREDIFYQTNNGTLTSEQMPTDNTESNDISSETDVETSRIVYWVSSGSVWHTNRDCPNIKNKPCIYGSVEDAIQDGMKHICSNCAK